MKSIKAQVSLNEAKFKNFWEQFIIYECGLSEAERQKDCYGFVEIYERLPMEYDGWVECGWLVMRWRQLWLNCYGARDHLNI